MVSIEVVESIKAFQDMNDAQRAAIQKHCEELQFKRNDKLFTEGDAAEHMWNVIEGHVDLRFEMPDRRPTSADMTVSSVEVTKKEPEARTLGWSCFVPPYKMRLSAYCVTKTCRIVRVKKASLLDLFDKDSLMGYKFMSYMITVVGFRFQQFQDHVAKNMGEDLMSGW